MFLSNLSTTLSTSAFLRRTIAWLTGFSLSTVVIISILFVISIILRRKGYGVRLGLACIIFYARPGSRRFPHGVEVKLTTRFVGFIFGWFQGPLIDVYADRFYMKLRPSSSSYLSASSSPESSSSSTTSSSPLPRQLGAPKRPSRILKFILASFQVVESSYSSIVIRNVISRILAYIVRFLRVRVGKVHVWKDGGSWELKVEQFILSGHAYNLVGCKYKFSVNELLFNYIKKPVNDPCPLQPIQLSFALQRGIEIETQLGANLFSTFRNQRFVILDDLTTSLKATKISAFSPRILQLSIDDLNIQFSPGRSRSLLAKLPPFSPPSTKIRKPSLLMYWESSIVVKKVAFVFNAPTELPNCGSDFQSSSMASIVLDPGASRDMVPPETSSKIGFFLRLDQLKLDVYGKTAEENRDPMIHASLGLGGCSAGSASVDQLSQKLYEEAQVDASADGAEPMENIEQLINAKPELLLWIEDVSFAFDMNCARHYMTRMDVGGTGVVFAIDPVGLVTVISELRILVKKYFERKHKRQNVELQDPAEIPSSSSSQSSGNSDGGNAAIVAQPQSVRVVCDIRHCTSLVLGTGAASDGDTLAMVACCEKVVLSNVDFMDSSLINMLGSLQQFELIHWSRWGATKTIASAMTNFNIQNSPGQDEKLVELINTHVNWDVDAHSGLEMIPFVFSALKDLRSSNSALKSFDNANGAVWTPPSSDSKSMRLPDSDSKHPDQPKRVRGRDSILSWYVKGQNISLSISFPDGPKMRMDVSELPKLQLNAKTIVGRHVVVTLQDHKCAYAEELRMGSPLHTMGKDIVKRSIDINLHNFVLILGNEEQFGYLIQDWLLRLKTAIRILRDLKWQKKGMDPPRSKKKPMFDIHFKCSNTEIYFEDHPISSFLTRMLPLMQDESFERVKRNEAMDKFNSRLSSIARAEIAGTPFRAMEALKAKDSDIWIKRVNDLQATRPSSQIANGYLSDMQQPPAASFIASSFSFDVVLDDHAREHGSKESLRKMKMLDDYELGTKKHNKTRQYDRDAWNSIGFRTVHFEATGVSVQLRDYPLPFLIIDRLYFNNGIMGQAVQAAVAPYISYTTIALGKRRLVKIVKGLGPTKSFVDVHVKADRLHCHFNPSYLAGIADFGKGVAKFFSGGKNPSPRIPWFDSLRVSMHGRMRLTAKKFTGDITSSTSPYSMTDHFLEIESDNFEMLTSRLEPTKNDPFPISWKFHNWRIRPSTFDNNRRSEIILDFVRVSLNPILSVNSGDPQDHYFVPFPTKEEVLKGGPGIGRGTMTLVSSDEPVNVKDNGFGNFTDWLSDLHYIPGHDTFADYKLRSMILGIDVFVRHAESDSTKAEHLKGIPRPEVSSILYSDAISTLSAVINTIIQRPISCRLPPRRASAQRKPPSETGFSTSLRGLDVNVDAKNINLMMYNNLEPGHGLFLSVDSLSGELWKRTDVSMGEDGETIRNSRVTRRRVDIVGIYSSIQVPGLDMAVDSNNMGKLLTVDKISLSDNIQDEMRYAASPRKGDGHAPSSGFGTVDLDKSPFYTYSTNHPLQRGNALDKFKYDKRLLIDGVRLIWSPFRRISMFAWPDAFKVKSFCMSAPRSTISDLANQPDESSGHSTSLFDENGGQGSNKKAVMSNKEEPMNDVGSKACTSDEHASTDSRMSKDQGVEPGGTSRDNSVDGGESNSGRKDDSRFTSGDNSQKVSMPKSKVPNNRKHVGSMVDLLSPHESTRSSSDHNDQKRVEEGSINRNNVSGSRKIFAFETLESKPKFALYINDCEVVFGSPETSSHVFLRSKAVRAGILNKKVQKYKRTSLDSEPWIDREYRFHLDSAEIYTRDKAKGKFDFNSRNWVGENLGNGTLSLLTQPPISMDLLYITSSSLPSEDGGDPEVDDVSLRPSLLFINIPHLKLSTNASEFHAMTDVVRKVLMQSMRSSEIVTEELSKLRYKIQLTGGKVSSKDLEEYLRQLTSITRQFLYAADTSQHHLVKNLMLSDEKTFADTLQRYKAKAKAVATFLRKDQRAMTADVLYPTMYISYSFDVCSWELREAREEQNKEIEEPFVSIALENLVCRHIFYVGRGSSTEITFGNIYAQNKMQYSYFKRILQPASGPTGQPSGSNNEAKSSSGIKASDGSTVAFRWYSSQEDRVGGIPVYDLLTIQVAPMTAAVTRKLYTSVSDFIFSTKSKHGESESTKEEAQENSRRGLGFARGGSKHLPENVDSVPKAGSSELTAVADVNHSDLDDVSQMAKRGETTILFKYIFIDAFELTASYKNKDTESRGALDVFDLFVTTPSFSYSSKIWTWKSFSSQIRRDLVTTFFVRGATNLAKIKLLPGYNRARKRLVQGADSVKEKFYNPFPSSSSTQLSNSKNNNNSDGSNEGDHIENDESAHAEEDVRGVLNDGTKTDGNVAIDVDDQESAQDRIDAAVLDIGEAADPQKREQVIKLLYGEQGLKSIALGPYSPSGRLTDNEAETSSQDSGFRARAARALGSGRSRTASSRSHTSADDEKKGRLLRKLRR